MITVRASSLPELFDCPARWEAKHLRKMDTPKSSAAQLGTAVHASTAAFDSARLAGSPITADEAAGAAVDAIHKPEAEVLWDELAPAEAEKIALALNSKYCSGIAPSQQYLGIEVKCDGLEITDLGLILTGTTDRVRVSQDGEIGIADIKTGARAVNADGTVNAAGHVSQLGVYELLAGHALGQRMTAPAQVIGMQTGKTERAQRVATAEVSCAASTLIGDEFTQGLLEVAASMFHAGLFYGNPRSYLCGKKYCPIYEKCRFRG